VVFWFSAHSYAFCCFYSGNPPNQKTHGVTNLLDEYKRYIEKKDYEKANKNCKKIKKLFLESVEAQPDEVMWCIEEHWIRNNFAKMMPLLFVAADLYRRSSNVRGMISCIKGVLWTMDSMDGNETNMKKLWRKHQLPFMHKIKDDIGKSVRVAFIDKCEAMIIAHNYIKDGEKCAGARFAARKTAFTANTWRWRLARKKRCPKCFCICCGSFLCLFVLGLIIPVCILFVRYYLR